MLWWPAWSGGGAERSGLDRPLFERGWFSGRSPGGRSGSSSATARIGSGLLSQAIAFLSSADRCAKRSEGGFCVCPLVPHRV